MPYKFETNKTKMPREKDRRVKLSAAWAADAAWDAAWAAARAAASAAASAAMQTKVLNYGIKLLEEIEC